MTPCSCRPRANRRFLFCFFDGGSKLGFGFGLGFGTKGRCDVAARTNGGPAESRGLAASLQLIFFLAFHPHTRKRGMCGMRPFHQTRVRWWSMPRNQPGFPGRSFWGSHAFGSTWPWICILVVDTTYIPTKFRCPPQAWQLRTDAYMGKPVLVPCKPSTGTSTSPVQKFSCHANGRSPGAVFWRIFPFRATQKQALAMGIFSRFRFCGFFAGASALVPFGCHFAHLPSPGPF